MKEFKILAADVGLPPNASGEQIVARIKALGARARQAGGRSLAEDGPSRQSRDESTRALGEFARRDRQLAEASRRSSRTTNEATAFGRIWDRHTRHLTEARLSGRAPLAFAEWMEADRELHPDEHTAAEQARDPEGTHVLSEGGDDRDEGALTMSEINERAERIMAAEGCSRASAIVRLFGEER